MGINPYNPPDIGSIGNGTYLRLDGTNSPTTGPITFNAAPTFNIRPRFNDGAEFSLGSALRFQVTPGGPYQSGFSVGAGVIQFGITGFSNNIAGRGLVLQNETTITPGAFQVARTVLGTTINARDGFAVDFRVNAVTVAQATQKGFKLASFTDTTRDAIASPVENLMIWNTTTKKINFYNGTAWRQVDDSAV
jgi:hypothetical protein